MHKFLHISDLHIRSTRIEGNYSVEKRLKRINERFPDHILLITGDIVDDGLPDQYKEALRLFQPFMSRILCCPGNHDFGDFGNLFSQHAKTTYRQFALLTGCGYWGKSYPFASRIWQVEVDMRIFLLDSNLHTYRPWDFARGDIGQRQLDILLRLFCPGDINILLLHHHPFARNLAGELRDWKRFMEAIRGKADVLCFGHKHKWGYYPDKYGIPHVLAADSLKESDKVMEIIVESKKNIFVNEVYV